MPVFVPSSSPAPARPPFPIVLEGRLCRLEPLEARHGDDLFVACCGADGARNHRYLAHDAPGSAGEMRQWIGQVASDPGQLFFAVIDRRTGRCGGRQAFMRIRPEHGSIEIGSILWGRGIARTAIATEALYLTARHVFQDLGYRRFEWKCDDLNIPSRRAAIRFGFSFEGVFRQDLIVRGKNRDTAWFSMLDREWPDLKPLYEDWLKPENFDGSGAARTPLATPRMPLPA